LFDADNLNIALAMSLEWGPVRARSLTERLRERFPNHTAEQIAAMEQQCNAIESVAWREIERVYLNQITKRAADSTIFGAFPLISEENLSSLWTQGQYYAWHDNG
jgi:hypothetical protein